jgi:hypothetical protein
MSAGLNMPGIKVALDSRPGQCCVIFRTGRKSSAALGTPAAAER